MPEDHAAGTAGTEQVLRLADDTDVADRVAHDLVAALARAQAGPGGDASVVLTGGTISRVVHRRVVEVGAGDDGPDWGRVRFWWGDERYVAADDEERNAGQALADMLAHLPVDPARVHAMPASDDGFPDAEAAAWDHLQVLRAHADRRGDRPWFDVLILGIGPDGHCASLFPGRGEVESQAPVLAVHDSPKPPPTRISMGMTTLGRAREVWFVATGAAKAEAVARSVAGAADLPALLATPSAGPRGLAVTRWYLDEAAAGLLP